MDKDVSGSIFNGDRSDTLVSSTAKVVSFIPASGDRSVTCVV